MKGPFEVIARRRERVSAAMQVLCCKPGYGGLPDTVLRGLVAKKSSAGLISASNSSFFVCLFGLQGCVIVRLVGGLRAYGRVCVM